MIVAYNKFVKSREEYKREMRALQKETEWFPLCLFYIIMGYVESMHKYEMTVVIRSIQFKCNTVCQMEATFSVMDRGDWERFTVTEKTTIAKGIQWIYEKAKQTDPAFKNAVTVMTD